jgi:hypothetical protein
VDKAPVAPELPEQIQSLIKKEFAFSEDESAAQFEGAMALARFGQYEAAINEFERLLNEGVMPHVAARNIITCHMTYSSADMAVATFEKWLSQDSLTKHELKHLRSFLLDLLNKKGECSI